MISHIQTFIKSAIRSYYESHIQTFIKSAIRSKRQTTKSIEGIQTFIKSAIRSTIYKPL